MHLRLVPTLLLAALLPACTILPPAPPTATLHDFGPLPEQTTAPPCRVTLRVTVPTWLDSGAVHYRHAADTQLAAYRDHRWAAAPSALLARHIEALLASPGTGSPACRLEVDLTAFEQRFLPEGGSAVRLTARALLFGHDGAIIARNDFVLTEPTDTADVQGGIPALAGAADTLARQVVDWLGTTATGVPARGK